MNTEWDQKQYKYKPHQENVSFRFLFVKKYLVQSKTGNTQLYVLAHGLLKKQ